MFMVLHIMLQVEKHAVNVNYFILKLAAYKKFLLFLVCQLLFFISLAWVHDYRSFSLKSEYYRAGGDHFYVKKYCSDNKWR